MILKIQWKALFLRDVYKRQGMDRRGIGSVRQESMPEQRDAFSSKVSWDKSVLISIEIPPF